MNLSQLVVLMEPFINGKEVMQLLNKLTDAGILMKSPEIGFKLSEQGLALHGSCLRKQQLFREKSMAGIDAAAYQQVVATLEKVARNLS
jgi:Mn-dependent DtxR family transcriptional regulator